MLKRRRYDRFHVASTLNSHDVFVGIANTIYIYTSSNGKRATYKGHRKSGQRIEKAKSQSIDNLELQAVKLAIKSFFREYRNCHIRI